jgi:hypothetical protein
MRTLAFLISAICAVMMTLTWNTAEAMAWTVAFCGWFSHCFKNKEAQHGNS